MSNRFVFILGFLLVVILSVLLATYASAHEAPSGKWKYPHECCHDQDCAPVDSVARTNPTDGSLPQLIVTTKHGTVIVPPGFKVEQSGDNQMHACMRPEVWGSKDGKMKLICFFVPPTM